MLSISHAMTGAFIATALPFPPLSIPLVLASHYLEDWTPHWDVGTGLSAGTRKRSTAIIFGVVDLAIALTLVYFIWQFGRDSINWHAWLGVFFALLPDFLEAPRNFLRWEPAFTKPLNKIHKRLHHSTPNMVVGLMSQVIVVGTILWLTFYR